MPTTYQYSTNRGEPCRDCEKTMRLRTDTAEDYPGTVVHAGHGRCSSCKSAARRQGIGISGLRVNIRGADAEDERDRFNARTTQAWLDQRRARGVPPEGTLPDLQDEAA